MKKFGLVVMLMLFALMVFAPMVGAMEKNPGAIVDMGITVAEACEAAIMVAAVVPEAPPGGLGIVASATLKNSYIMTYETTCKYLDPGPVIATSATDFAKIFLDKFGPVYSDAGARTYTMRYASTDISARPGLPLLL